MSNSKKTILGLFFAVLIFFASFSKANAFSCSSNGSGGGNFNVASTWSGCNSTTPQTSDSITINSGDTVTLVATTTVAGITINNGGVLAANTRAITNTGLYTNNGSQTGTTSTMNLSGSSGTVISGPGSYAPTGVVTVSIGSKTVSSGSSLSFDKITVTGVTLTNNSTAGFTVVTALAGTGQLTQGTSSILNIVGTSTITSLDASASSNEVHYTSTTANQTIKTPTSSYYHLFIDKSGRVGTLAAATTINGNLSVTAGTLADGGFQITGNATGILTLAAGTTLTLGTVATATNFPTSSVAGNIALNTTSTVNYNSNSAQTISNIPTYGNLTTTATSAVTKTADGAIIINGNWTNGANNTFDNNGFVLTVKGNASNSGTHTGSGKMLLTGGSTAHSISGTGSYNNVELNDSNGAAQTATTNIGGTFTITSGTWTPSGNTLTVTGNTLINGTLSIVSTAGTKTFGNITINNGGSLSFSAAEAMAINGDLTVNGTGTISGTSGVWTFQKVGGGSISGTVTSLTILGSTTFATQYAILVPLTVNTFTVGTGINETNNSTITINTSLAGAGTFTQSANTILNLGGGATVTTLDASANPNEVHYTSTTANQTLKATTYFHLFVEKNGRTGTVSTTTNVLGNLAVTSGSTLSLGTSFLTIIGTTDIYGILSDTNNTGLGSFGGLVTVHSGGSWTGNLAEACDFNFSNGFVFNGTSFVTGQGTYTFQNNNQGITGSSSITLGKIVVTGISLTNSSSAPLTVQTSLSGSGTFIQDAGAILNLAGTNTIATFDAGNPGNTVSYTGTSSTIKDSTYDTLDLSANTGGAMNLAADTSVNTILNLGDIKLSTGANKIMLASGASWSRISGYVLGEMRKVFNASTSFTFPMGDSTNYLPLDLTLSGVTNIASMDTTTTGADYPDTIAGSSGIDKDKSVNRFWSLVNNGLIFGSYDIVLHFASSDIDEGSSPTDMTVAKKSGGSWNILSSSCTSTSCIATGLTSMSEFQIGVRQAVSSGVSDSPSSTFTLNLLQTFLPQLTPFLPQPSQEANTPALFDILSSPLFPDLGRTNNAIILPVATFAFFGGSFMGAAFLAGTGRRRRSRAVVRYSRRRHII